MNQTNNDTGVPLATAHRLDARFTADQLDHPAWANAEPIPIARRWSGEAAPATQHAEARIIWSPNALNVRFVCRQAETIVQSTNPQLSQKSIGLWERDVCEIFLAPDPQQPDCYYEFEVAPTGEWLDLGIRVTPAGRETEWEFQSGLTVASRVENDRVTLALSIPWSEAIPEPRPGAIWRVNLFRCVGLGSERYLAWQPTYTPEPYFHVPEVFGELKFLQTADC
jgi:hypothetical protein